MGKTKSVDSSQKKFRPALSPEMRENQMISLAIDLAEKQLREGTATSQVITHFLKLATEKDRLERDILKKQKDLIEAKTQNLKSLERLESLYTNALNAMKEYSGNGGNDDEID